jgi:hypothetical protein
MRQAARMLDAPAGLQMLISRIPVALQDSAVPSQELLRTRSFSAHPKLIHHRAIGPAVLPKVTRVVGPVFGWNLHGYRGLIRLDVPAR